MSFADEEEFEAFVWRDSWLPMITAEAVGQALLDCPFAPLPEVTLGWLAMAVRRSLAASMRNVSDGPARKANADVRAELDKLAEQTAKTWAAVFDRSGEVDSRLWDQAFHTWEGTNALAADRDPNFPYNGFQKALARLDWLARFLRSAAEATEKQHANWRRAEQRAERIERARCLAPVFEKAFGQAVSANNWSGNRWSGDALAKAPTPFMEFYQRMVDLAYREAATPDLSGVTKEACRLHRREPFSFEGLIPGM